MLNFDDVAQQLRTRAWYLAGTCLLLCVGSAFDAAMRLHVLNAAIAVMWGFLCGYWLRTAIRETRMLRNARRHLSEQ